MRFSFVSSLLLAGASAVSAASSWSFDDATLTVQAKGAGVGGGVKEKYSLLSNAELRHKADHQSVGLTQRRL